MVQMMPLRPKTPSSLASFKSRLVLPFWYQLTQLVLEKRLLNGCSSSFFSLVHKSFSQQTAGFPHYNLHEPGTSTGPSVLKHMSQKALVQYALPNFEGKVVEKL